MLFCSDTVTKDGNVIISSDDICRRLSVRVEVESSESPDLYYLFINRLLRTYPIFTNKDISIDCEKFMRFNGYSTNENNEPMPVDYNRYTISIDFDHGEAIKDRAFGIGSHDLEKFVKNTLKEANVKYAEISIDSMETFVNSRVSKTTLYYDN